MADWDFTTANKHETENSVKASTNRGRTSEFEPLVEAWNDFSAKEKKEKELRVEGLEQNKVQNLRSLFYRRFEKEDVLVRAFAQDDDTYVAVIRQREGDEFLRK